MKKWISVLPVSAILLTISMLYSCSGSAQQSQAATPVTPEAMQKQAPAAAFQNVDAGTLQKMTQENPGIVLLDVRTAQEVASGIIPGAVHIDISRPDFIEKINQLDKSKSYVVYCRSGRRSVSACNTMANEGFQQLYNLQGGILSWNARQ
jgi:rhodanese-related sulfurtransferase